MTARLALSPALIWLTRAIYRESVEEMGHINLMTDRQVQAQIAAADLRIVERYKSGLYIPIVAELTGEWGQCLAERWEPRVRDSKFDGLLWTQYYVAKRAGSSV